MNAHEHDFLAMLVRTYEHSLMEIADVEANVMECAQKFHFAVSLIETIPGIQRLPQKQIDCQGEKVGVGIDTDIRLSIVQ